MWSYPLSLSLLINSVCVMQEPTAVEIILEYILEVMRLCSIGLPVTEMMAELYCGIFPGTR